MATATDPTKAILDRIGNLETQLKDQNTALGGWVKAAQTAATKAGTTPEALFARLSDNGQKAVVVDGSGNVMPVATPKNRFKSLGKAQGADGKDYSFGDYLHHQRIFQQKGMAAEGSIDFLTKAGAYGTISKPDSITKTALAESSGVTGGYGVPPEFANRLLTLAVENEFFTPRASKETMTTQTKTLPSLDMTTSFGAGVSPFLGGVTPTWTAEAATMSESEPKLRQTQLVAQQLSFYLIFSNNLWQDESVGLDSLVTTLMSKAIAWAREYAYINGNGVGKPLGVQNAAATIQVTRTSAAHINWYDIPAMFSKMIYSDLGDLIWVAHPSCIPDILKLNDQSGSTSGVGTGRVLFVPFNEGAQESIPRPAGPTSFGRLLGMPLFLSEKMPALGTTGCIMLVDPTKYLIGERMEIEIDVSPHVYFTSNQTVIRINYRGDGQPWLQSAITLADGTYQVSPFTILTQ